MELTLSTSTVAAFPAGPDMGGPADPAAGGDFAALLVGALAPSAPAVPTTPPAMPSTTNVPPVVATAAPAPVAVAPVAIDAPVTSPPAPAPLPLTDEPIARLPSLDASALLPRGDTPRAWPRPALRGDPAPPAMTAAAPAKVPAPAEAPGPAENSGPVASPRTPTAASSAPAAAALARATRTGLADTAAEAAPPPPMPVTPTRTAAPKAGAHADTALPDREGKADPDTPSADGAATAAPSSTPALDLILSLPATPPLAAPAAPPLPALPRHTPAPGQTPPQAVALSSPAALLRLPVARAPAPARQTDPAGDPAPAIGVASPPSAAHEAKTSMPAALRDLLARLPAQSRAARADAAPPPPAPLDAAAILPPVQDAPSAIAPATAMTTPRRADSPAPFAIAADAPPSPLPDMAAGPESASRIAPATAPPASPALAAAPIDTAASPSARPFDDRTDAARTAERDPAAALPPRLDPVPAAAALPAASDAPATGASAPTAPPVDSSAALATRHLAVAHDGAWLDRLARDIAMTAGREGEMRFTLNPEHLGSLAVEVRQTAEGAAVRLSTETEAARSLIADAQPRLIAEARAQGLRLAEAHVDLTGQNGSAQQHQQQPRQQQQPPAPAHSAPQGRPATENRPAVTVNQDLAARGERYA